MQRRDRIDTFGALALIGFSAFLGFNQVIIKVVNEGLQPVFWAGLRSLGAIPCIWLLMRLRGRRPDLRRETWGGGLLLGLAFSFEFVFLFLALDLTTVTRSSVIFYSMPVWFAIMANFLLPGERLTRNRLAGLLLAFAGVTWAIVNRGGGAGEASLAGDLCALGGAISWAAIALVARGTKISGVDAQTQLLWQVGISAPILLAISPLFGEFLRDPQPIHWWGLGVQIVFVVSVGFTVWLWLLSVYPPASVAAFSFLTPIFGVSMGWLILGEDIQPGLIGALALVIGGLVLINRPRRPQVPQKVR
ncbi:DMT family transporter [Aliiruegeria sabulilitoris]|uniref:DMT family transporter n=1 Tax=Aliiruegeria sabulilitoris TaxID=1510458 RepID=UPI000830BA0F|nr:DMT family transporter [Aliiruegeria sabulilitoris]NDR56467.1 DMT family transporter [Pseudoruegeria sp. M32A2M]